MIDIIASVPNIDPITGNRINGEFRGDTVPGDGTGTPALENWVNDLYYPLIASMDAAGITANNVDEGVNTSQFRDSLEYLVAETQELSSNVTVTIQPYSKNLRIICNAGLTVLGLTTGSTTRANIVNVVNYTGSVITINVTAGASYTLENNSFMQFHNKAGVFELLSFNVNSIGVGDGTVSAPSIYNIGDNNTGVYFPSNNNMGLVADGSEIVRVNSTGVGIEIIPEYKLDVAVTGSNTGVRFSNGTAEMWFLPGTTASSAFNALVGAGDNVILFHEGSVDTGNMVIGPWVSSPMAAGIKLFSTGEVSLGAGSIRSIGTITSKFLIETVGETRGMSLVSNSDTNYYDAAYINLGRSRGTTQGAFDLLSDNDHVGSINFAGADGTDITTQAASIYCEINGTPASNFMPADLVFSTNPGGGSATESFRITTGKQLVINGPSTIAVVAGGIHLEMDGTVGDAFVVKDGVTEYAAITNLGQATFAHATVTGHLISGSVAVTGVLSVGAIVSPASGIKAIEKTWATGAGGQLAMFNKLEALGFDIGEYLNCCGYYTAKGPVVSVYHQDATTYIINFYDVSVDIVASLHVNDSGTFSAGGALYV